MDNQKLFREKKFVEILIVVIVVIFLAGSIAYVFLGGARQPAKKSAPSVSQSVLNSLTAPASSTTIKVSQAVLDSLSAPSKSASNLSNTSKKK